MNLTEMTIYEFITPSDPITFKADNDKIAFFAALILGRGKAGCENKDTGNKLPSMMMFSDNADKEIRSFLGCTIHEFMASNMTRIKNCFSSFAYGSVSERKNYEDAIGAITNPDKLKEFKERHENNNRTSTNKWVKQAWIYAENLGKNQ